MPKVREISKSLDLLYFIFVLYDSEITLLYENRKDTSTLCLKLEDLDLAHNMGLPRFERGSTNLKRETAYIISKNYFKLLSFQ